MGCKYACTCSGTCYNCDRYKKESYIGEAEDMYDELYPRRNKADEEYEREFYKEYENEQNEKR